MDVLEGAKALQCSNPSPILLNALKASALLFPPMEEVRERSWTMTQKCRNLLKTHDELLTEKGVSIITPEEKQKCGAQLSFHFKHSDAPLYFEKLHAKKVNQKYLS